MSSWAPAAPVSILPPVAAAPSRRGWLPIAGAVTAVVALAAVALVVLGGSSGSKADAATIVRAASQQATSVGSSSLAMDMKITVSGHTVHATGVGSFDFRRGVGSISMDMAGMGQLQEVVTRKGIYMRLPDALRGALGANRPWIEMRFSAMKSSGVDMAKLMNANPTGDPSSMLRVLAKATTVHEDGSETVRGISTTRYSVTTTIQDLLRAEGLAGSVDLSKAPAGMASQPLHFVVCVDKQGLPRRVIMDMDMAGMGTMTLTMDMFDYGAPVHIVIPPKSIVTDVSKQLAG